MEIVGNTLIVVVLLGGFIAIGFILNKKFEELKKGRGVSEDLVNLIKTIQEGSAQDRKVLLDSLARNTSSLNIRLDNAAKIIGDVQKNLGEMSEIGRGMRELQQFLQSPKLRGNIGEEVLKDIITQMFPRNSFHLQYSFKSGERVDAVIKTSAGILPIDSKFPMENFQKMSLAENEKDQDAYRKKFVKDIKKHIKDIEKKYILPEEGTMDFALMYIPSESVYYEVVNDMDLANVAKSSRVYPVSPTTLYAHLQTILLSFEGQKIETRAKEVFAMLRAIQKDYGKIESNLSVLQKHLNNAGNVLGNVRTGFNQLGQKIVSAKSLKERN